MTKFNTKDRFAWSNAMAELFKERLGEPTSSFTKSDSKNPSTYSWNKISLPNGAVVNASVHYPEKGVNGRYDNPWIHIRVPTNVDESNYGIGRDNGKRNLHLFEFDGHTVENAIVFSDAHIERTFRDAKPEILPENNPELTPFVKRAWHYPVAICVGCLDGSKDGEETFTVSSYSVEGKLVRERSGIKYSDLKAQDGRFVRLSAADLIGLNKNGWSKEKLMAIHEKNQDLEARRKERRKEAV